MTTAKSMTLGSSTTSTLITSSKLDAQLNSFVLYYSIILASNLVSTLLTRSNNYSSWNRAMMLFLSGKNKIGFITDAIKKPTEGNLLCAWKCNNGVIASWIINSFFYRNCCQLSLSWKSVKKIWDKLKERY